MRRHDVKMIHLEIDKVNPFKNEKYEGFTISWSSDIGFGEYRIYRKTEEETGIWYGDSECMDMNDDKAFLEELMSLFIKRIQIIE